MKYHIYHATGAFIVSVAAENDALLWQKISDGSIPEIKPYIYLQVYSEDRKSQYPHISKRLAEPEPEKEEK